VERDLPDSSSETKGVAWLASIIGAVLMNDDYQVDLGELAEAAVQLDNVSALVAEQCAGADFSTFSSWSGGLAALASARFESAIRQVQQQLAEQGDSHPATLALIAKKYEAQEADAAQAIKQLFEGRIER